MRASGLDASHGHDNQDVPSTSRGSGGGVSSCSWFWPSGASDEKRQGDDAHDVPAVGTCEGSGRPVTGVPMPSRSCL